MLKDQLRCPQAAVVVYVQPVGQVHAIADLSATFGLVEADGLQRHTVGGAHTQL